MVNEAECLAAHVDAKKVGSLARRLIRISRELAQLHIILFGGSGHGSLRYDDNSGKGRLVLADLGGNVFDGGDGACGPDEDGLERGE
jgi:hypothetical protein